MTHLVDIAIRPMRLCDIDRCYLIDLHAYPDFASRSNHHSTYGLHAPGITSYVATDQDEVVAYVMARQYRDILCIHRLAVHPNYQLRGIGRMLLDHLDHQHDNDEIRCLAGPHEGEAAAFLERCGFRCIHAENRIWSRKTTRLRVPLTSPITLDVLSIDGEVS